MPESLTDFDEGATEQSLAADGSIACFSSNLFRLSLNANRAPQLKALVRCLSLDMKLTAFIAAVILLSAASSYAKNWRGIVPLHSTRADVERLLGPPDTDRGSAIFYTIGFSRVSFDFPYAPCGRPGSLWNVASNIVTEIWVTHQQLHEVRLSDVNVSSGFRTQKDVELDYILYYINDTEGISYEVDTRYGTDANGAIIALTKYFPPAKEDNLRCLVRRGRVEHVLGADSPVSSLYR